jgi:hypothetical protein
MRSVELREYQPELRPRTIPELLDIAFSLYRAHLRTFVVVLALPSLLWLLVGVLILAYARVDEILGYVVFAGRLNRGDDAVAVLALTFFREACFADGVILWSLMATAFAPAVEQAYLRGRVAWREIQWSFFRSLGLALLIGIPVIGLRLLGLGPLAELARLPVLFAPQVLAIERRSLPASLYRSWSLVRHDALRTLVLLVPALALVRLAIFAPFIGLLLLNRWVFLFPIVRSRWWIGLLALMAELLICSVSQIMISLLYYDQRVRREGLDIALATAHWSESSSQTAKVANTP